VSAALAAAGRCVALAGTGITPTDIVYRDGGWDIRAKRLPPHLAAVITVAGTIARQLAERDEPDVMAAIETAQTMIGLQDDFGDVHVAACQLIDAYKTTVRAIADVLMAEGQLGGWRLFQQLEPILREYEETIRESPAGLGPRRA
jgi:hypothetical protein